MSTQIFPTSISIICSPFPPCLLTQYSFVMFTSTPLNTTPHHHRVFDQLLSASKATNGQVIIKVSYLQIYCEVVSDLLDPSGSQLSIRERNGEVYVENLSESVISSYSDVQRIIERGNMNRNTATTNMNAHSSRSHAAMLVKIFTPDVGNDPSSLQQKSLRESTLVLVDLAGSERSSAIAGKSYLRAEESKSINLSLSALGNCISALSASTTQTALGANSTRKKHVPYRDSKLTRLLQGSLGGSSRTAVIVNLPPGIDSTGEILNALRFAHRCSTITVVANVRRVVDYETLYAELQKRLDEQEQREREQQMDLDKQYELSEVQDSTMEALRDEIKTLTMQNEQLKAKNNAESTAQPDMKQYVDEMAAQSALELSNMKQRYEKRIAAYKSAATAAAQEISELQYDVRTEREKHLSTFKDLNVVNERYSEAERAFEFRIQELLTELEEAKNAVSNVDKLTAELDSKDSKISELEEKIYLLEENGGGADMVSRQAVEEMEKMFSETVEQLVQRVMILEESKNGGAAGGGGKVGKAMPDIGDSDEEDEMAYLDKVGPNLRKNRLQNAGHSSHLPPAVPIRSTGNARFEPGKVRATGGNAGSSHHIGGNFGGGAKNSRRF